MLCLNVYRPINSIFVFYLALSVEERLRENKKKQEAAKKAQSANAAKGRNAFKLQLEANKP